MTPGPRIRSNAAALLFAAALVAPFAVVRAAPAPQLPELTASVNDFAHVIDDESTAAIDRLSRALMAASGDVIAVATVQTIEPYADIDEYANKLFENHGRGIGTKGKDNGVLIVVAIQQRKVKIEVGYGLEEWITDGFAGETIRAHITPEFRRGDYGAGLRAGVARIAGRIAEARGVQLQGVPVARQPEQGGSSIPVWIPIAIFLAILIVSRIGGGPGSGVRRWGGGPWSGWSSGVGPFAGGWGGGGFGGGGFGGGFGGFGGGRSGGGGASGGW